MRIGVIGLGAGSIAGFGQRGDVIRFYEIDPQIRDYAERYFSFLGASAAQVEHRIGDGRLSLSQEDPQAFDLLVLDAFSGDSIPVHLLTREAMAIYERHLRSDGVMLVHISNLHLDLRPVVAGMAASANMLGFYTRHVPDEGEPFVTASHWSLLTRDSALLDAPAIRQVAERLTLDPRFTPWTDDYSNIFGLLK